MLVGKWVSAFVRALVFIFWIHNRKIAQAVDWVLGATFLSVTSSPFS